jgi:HSP20 family protein
MAGTLSSKKPGAMSGAQQRDPLSMIRQEMDDLLSRFWNGGQESWFGGMMNPQVDLAETDNSYELRMDIPGVEASDIDVQVHGNQVTVSGQRKQEKEEKGKTFHHLERHSGTFSRSVTLPCNVNENEVAAQYNQGVLTVVLPKCEDAKARKITVKS